MNRRSFLGNSVKAMVLMPLGICASAPVIKKNNLKKDEVSVSRKHLLSNDVGWIGVFDECGNIVPYKKLDRSNDSDFWNKYKYSL